MKNRFDRAADRGGLALPTVLAILVMGTIITVAVLSYSSTAMGVGHDIKNRNVRWQARTRRDRRRARRYSLLATRYSLLAHTFNNKYSRSHGLMTSMKVSNSARLIAA